MAALRVSIARVSVDFQRMLKDPYPAESPAGEGFAYSGTELDSMAEARNYYSWILGNFLPYIGPQVIEVGAGVGTLAAYLLAARPSSKFTLIEPAANLFPALKARHGNDPRVRVLQGTLEEHAAELTADSVIMVNVLEHVSDDDLCLRTLHGVLRSGGTLLLFVPALPWIYGTLDRAFDHYRRYTKAELRGKLARAGFRVGQLRYMNLPGVAAWYLVGKIMRRTTLRPASVRFYDRWVVPWWSRIEHRWAPPLGQSLLAVAVK
jgi:SAM-dependent methyltransferase